MSSPKVSDYKEYELIEIISEIIGGLGNDVLEGEDDAVGISLKNLRTAALIINTDMLVSTTDVPPKMTLYEAGRKAVVMTVSDVLVKGAIPRWAVVSLGVPRNLDVEGVNGFKGIIMGLKDGFTDYGVKYLGGDLNETNEIVISTTIFGESVLGNVLKRSGAHVGDIIISTDVLGKTGCGFEILLNNRDSSNISEEQRKTFIQSVLLPETSQYHGKTLLGMLWATASADSSDGVLKTIYSICHASGLGAQIMWEELPIADGVQTFVEDNNLDIEDIIFRAGEEFLHIFTVPEKSFASIQAYMKAKNQPVYKIGKITKEKDKILLTKAGKEKQFINSRLGFEHFESTQYQKLMKYSDSENIRDEDIFESDIKDEDIFEGNSTSEEQKKTGLAVLDQKSEPEETEKIIHKDMEGYLQYPGACGLTSLLMALKPETTSIAPILNSLWARIQTLFGMNANKNKEYNWQRVIEWLLFKVVEEPKLQTLLRDVFGSHFDDGMFPKLIIRIKEKNPHIDFHSLPIEEQWSSDIDLSKLNGKWIMKRVQVWKEDFELEIIAALFGCKFIPWPKTEDGTGAVFFKKGEVKTINAKTKEKLDFLLPLVNNGGPALCCASIHWLAIREIKVIGEKSNVYIVRYNDPANGQTHTKSLSSFGESERFYLFKFDPEKLKKNKLVLAKLKI